MAELVISELSRATGFPSSALRYYERVGLLRPVGRTAGGYRLYDERAVERLEFIGHAKRMGLNLDDITELMALWDDGPCSPVQERLRALVDDKVASLQSRIDELVRFQAQLGHVQRSLASAEPTDRCGPGCGCDTDVPDVPDEHTLPVAFGRSMPAPENPSVAIACTLGADDAVTRTHEWQLLLSSVESREVTPGGMRLRFPRDPELLGSLAALTAREVECCSFFTFTLTLDHHGALLDVNVPPEGVPLVSELFGPLDD